MSHTCVRHGLSAIPRACGRVPNVDIHCISYTAFVWRPMAMSLLSDFERISTSVNASRLPCLSTLAARSRDGREAAVQGRPASAAARTGQGSSLQCRSLQRR